LFFTKLPLSVRIWSVRFEQSDLASTAEELMRQHWVWAAGLAAGLASGAARAEEVVLRGVEVRSSEQCLEVLAELNWVCEDFDSPGWIKVWGRSYWELGQLHVFRYDLDGDGSKDAALWINHLYGCGTSGCSFKFVFGNVPAPERLWSYGTSNSPPSVSVTKKSGFNHVQIGNLTWLASDLKAKVIGSMQLGLE
jgi:hypothetical protein